MNFPINRLQIQTTVPKHIVFSPLQEPFGGGGKAGRGQMGWGRKKILFQGRLGGGRATRCSVQESFVIKTVHTIKVNVSFLNSSLVT